MADEKVELRLNLGSDTPQTRKTRGTLAAFVRWPMLFARSVGMHLAVAAWAFNQFHTAIKTVFDYMSREWQRQREAIQSWAVTMRQAKFGLPGQEVGPGWVQRQLPAMRQAGIPLGWARAALPEFAAQLPRGAAEQYQPLLYRAIVASGGGLEGAPAMGRLVSLMVRNYPRDPQLAYRQMMAGMITIPGGMDVHRANLQKMIGQASAFVGLREALAAYGAVATSTGALGRDPTSVLRIMTEITRRADALREFGVRGVSPEGRITDFSEVMRSINEMPEEKRFRLTEMVLGRERARKFGRMAFTPRGQAMYEQVMAATEPQEARRLEEQIYTGQLRGFPMRSEFARGGGAYAITERAMREAALETLFESLTAEKGLFRQEFLVGRRFRGAQWAFATFGVESARRALIRQKMRRARELALQITGREDPRLIAFGMYAGLLGVTKAGLRGEYAEERMREFAEGGVPAVSDPELRRFFERFPEELSLVTPDILQETRRYAGEGGQDNRVQTFYFNGGSVLQQAANRLQPMLRWVGFSEEGAAAALDLRQ